MCSILHHVEICVREEKRLISLLIRGFGFTIIGQRLTPLALKWVLKHGSAIFVITKRQKDCKLQDKSTDDLHVNPHHEKECVHSNGDTTDPEHWTVFCCQDQTSHAIDSVFNAALEVKDVDEVTRRVKERGGHVLREPTNINDSHGQVRYSIVTSCLGNVVHTLIDKKNYSGEFLPGFRILGTNNCESSLVNSKSENGCHTKEFVSNPCDIRSYLEESTRNGEVLEETATQVGGPVFTHVDHIACVCEVGKSKELMAWYEYCFGMKRFMTNREESEEEGLVLGEEIGMRLKAMEYWRCAEVGLAVPSATLEDSELKMVIAEPLSGFENSQINTFLNAHKGPGIQHIALHTPSMAPTVKYVSQQGVVFRKAPPTYYQKGVKLEEITATGHEVELDLFQELGILLDTEDDIFSDMKDGQGKQRYLMQVFTTPIFQEDTFFMEVIQRCGARGFGVGNISALARSIILYQQQQQQNKLRSPSTT
ncbi:4-hydroxyphenylpyruvate dioxygenase-like protein isoform X2 [Eriocheir sinensis]|nr:4-hydroxyphenylpyruvate dioxygenase-like protein isoform X2 [Eriocheir sinensis]XP_050716576.1 4-hydroxyphenylpyruvate dioxygenase-like protein isoform X2 [Eriocheir sinensis]XP_050716577.1 4-hydroxyphenylpyruvate dioxygenase-like protein isoform X2 [Eriocheir sinensis]XP_050716578.1 4-hydroxyphenylpyruvate dioxygenase-like protein isoform X2 [Eriocheir sinensis]XP_050716579.1 4-hydroxyphenylpyruvate dioxygenase-like protein isoform X2 [Eriocheir sinensis]XP_050716580.1 4-hydroxyphenylpyruv